MTKAFEARLWREGIVDTSKYRYILKEIYATDGFRYEIQRLPIDLLDTTAALNDWETVKVYND